MIDSNNFDEALLLKIDDAQTVSAIHQKIQQWTGGQTILTQLLQGYVLSYPSKIARGEGEKVVDTIVETKILQDWRSGRAANHLRRIEEKLLRYEPRDSLLILYLQVLQRGYLPQKSTPEEALLLKTGLVRLVNDGLSIDSAIYAQVFDESWIENHLPGITRPVSIVQSPSASVKTARAPLPLPASLAAKPWLYFSLIAGALGLFAGIFLLSRSESNGWSWDSSREVVEPAIAQDAATNRSKEIVQLTLLGDTFSGYSTFRNEDFQSVLADSGIEINYADEFDQTLRARRLDQGDADLIVTSLDQFIQQQPNGKIVGLLDKTIGADAVVLNTKQYSSLKSLLDLKELVQQAKAQGKKLSIAYAADTPSEYLALVLDTQFDTFNLSDFELKPVADASEAWTLMQDPEDNVAIAVLWEPYVVQARKQGYSVVLSSEDAPNVIVDVVVASDRLIKSNPNIISLLLEKYYRRIDANARDAIQLQTQVAEDGALSIDEAASIIDGIDFFSATEAKNWFGEGTLKKRIEATAAVLTLSNRIEAIPADVSNLYTDQFVTEAANNTQALIDLIRADNPELADKLSGNLPVVTSATQASTEQIQKAPDIGNVQVQGQVSFAIGSAQLTEEGAQTLTKLAGELKEFNKETVALRVIGHTSQTGNAQANQLLSQQRATVVANYLKGIGVELSISPEGKGSNEPLGEIAPTDTRQQRTEIRLVRVE
ncbi:MAG: phosphate ABC transporter substrate-binding/OmpA family protein [Phormidesmis sp.]